MRIRAIALLAVVSLCLTAACATPQADDGSAEAAWAVKANYVDSCSCKPSCPCLFGSHATLGYCEGLTLIEIEQGHFGDVRLDGIEVVAVYRSGNWIKFYVTDEAPAQAT